MLTKTQIDELKQFDAPTICNAIEFFGIRSCIDGFMLPGLKQMAGDHETIVGYAATAKISSMKPSADPGIFMRYLEYVRETADPTIVVIQDIDEKSIASFWGEVNASTHKSLGAVGLVTNGAVRDLKEVNELNFHFHATCLGVSHGYAHIEEFGTPVNVLGMEVVPGELICADCHGVVKIPDEVAPYLAEACRFVAEAESNIIKPCRAAAQSGVKATMEEIRTWRTKMDTERKKGAEYYHSLITK